VTGLLVLAALLAPPVHYDLGVGVGAGTLARDAVLTVNPWIGVAQGDLALAVQAPLRMDFAGDGVLRERDWDAPVDYGRALRFVRYGEVARAGTLGDLTLGHGTLVRRYHNGVDDDRHRVGAALRLESASAQVHGFADQVFGPPVLGGRGALALGPVWLGATVVADAAAPRSVLPDADGPTEWLVASGVDLSWAAHPAVELYGDLNLLEGESLGAHLGGVAHHEGRDWRIEGRLEGARLGEGYEWALFDTGYLVDRWRPLAPALQSLRAAWGGRAGLTVGVSELGVSEGVEVGAEYADAHAPGRADLTVFVRVPDERFQLTAFARQRRVRRGDLLDGDEALAAGAGRLRVGGHVWFVMSIAQAWRTTDAGRLAPVTEAMLGLELAAGR
jgi:hypothetical protein